MKNLPQYLFDIECNNIILNETCNVAADDVINEAFQLQLLNRLASKIKEYESEKHARDVQKAEEYRKQNRLFKPAPTAETFTSLFGPIVIPSRYSSSEKKVRGCRWDKLTEKDVTYFEGGYDGTLHKLIKKLYGGKIYGMMIVCDPDTDDILYVVRGYNCNNAKGKPYKPATWKFRDWNNINQKQHKDIEHMQVYKKRRWGDDINADELIELIDDYAVYFITIPNELIDEYNTLIDDRKKAQSGIVNYDKESLKKLATQQQAHYRALAKELRAQRLESNPMFMFDEITEIQSNVNELYKRITSKPEYLEQLYSIGDLMVDVSKAFDYFFKYLRANQMHKKNRKRYEEKGYEYKNTWYKDEAVIAIDDCKNYLEKIKKDMGDIEKRMNEIK